MGMQRSSNSPASEKRRICIFCERWESGGIESFLTNLLTHMELSQSEIDIVVSELGNSVFYSRLCELGIHFIELSGSQRNVLKNNRLFREIMSEKQYDVLYVNAFQALSMRYLKLAKEYGIPVRIAHSHNTALRKSFLRPLKLEIHRLAGKKYTGYATHRLACSNMAARFMFPDKTNYTFIPNGIEVGRFAYSEQARNQTRLSLGIDDDCLLIGHVGRLCKQKNQMFLLDVLHEAKKIRNDVKLLLVGEGEDKFRLMSKAKSLKLQKDVVFFGTTDKPEALYSAMDVFAFPSLFEGLGIAAVEAQAAGLPIVCSKAVPNEAKLLDSAKTVGISAGAKEWAQALTEPCSRLNICGVLLQKIMTYDAAAVGKLFESIIFADDIR